MTEHIYDFKKNWFQKHKQARWKKYLPRFQDQKLITILEIGSYEGKSACWLCEQLGSQLQIDTVDPFVNSEVKSRFMQNTAPWRDKGILIHHEDFATQPMASMLAQNFEYDIIHIDGSHESLNVLYDGIMALRLVRVGGIICFDDYKWKADDTILPPKNVIDLLVKAHGPFINVLHRSGQLWLEKIKDFNSFMRMSTEK